MLSAVRNTAQIKNESAALPVFCAYLSLVICPCNLDLGSAYGTAKSAVGISSMGITNPDVVMKNIIPVAMASILGIYGLIISVIIVQNIKATEYSQFAGYAHLAGGLACGLSSLAAGLAIGIVGDSGVRAAGQNDDLYVPMVLILICAEAIGLYGLIIGIILSSASSNGTCTMPV